MSDSRAPAPPGKMVIFKGAGAPSLHESGMVYERSFATGASLSDLFEEQTTAVASTSVPFRQEGAEGFSLAIVDFPPGYLLPRHSHSADCLYYITEGGIEMGANSLGAGDGFFVPAEQVYAYRAGPSGVKLLEFRHRSSFDTKFYEKDAAAFRDRAAKSLRTAGSADGETGL